MSQFAGAQDFPADLLRDSGLCPALQRNAAHEFHLFVLEAQLSLRELAFPQLDALFFDLCGVGEGYVGVCEGALLLECWTVRCW
jgi:hypothetical protein